MSDSYAGFERWYAECHPRLLGVLTIVSGNADVASEATDEAFVRALARWQKVRAMKSPAGWTYKVALNILRRRLRRQRSEQELLRAGETVVQRDPSLWLQVLEALEPLTVRQRTVLALVYVADLPQDEVAELLHIARSTVASTLADAKEAVLSNDRDADELYRARRSP